MCLTQGHNTVTPVSLKLTNFDLQSITLPTELLFDLILYVPVNNFSVMLGRGLPGLNQY